MATDRCGVHHGAPGGPQSWFLFLLCSRAKTLLLLVWGGPCEGTVGRIGKTRGRHRCSEGSENEAFYSVSLINFAAPFFSKNPLLFFEIVLLPLWLASGGIFGISECPVLGLEHYKTRLKPPPLGSPGVACLERLFGHLGSSDSLVWGVFCVGWGGLRFYPCFIDAFLKSGAGSTSFVRFVFFKASLI